MSLRVISISLCLTSVLLAQESRPETQAETRFPEAEVVASTSFRSANYVQPIWKGLRFESDYFGGDENDVGFAGPAWEFRLRELRLAPAFGAAFGGNGFRSMPAVSVRWAFEKGRFITEGLIVQGLEQTARNPGNTPEEQTEGLVRPTITDGDHVSVEWRRLTMGGTWERIQFREIEWKGGGRVAIRIWPHLSAVVYVLGPDTEVRVGLILHPRDKK